MSSLCTIYSIIDVMNHLDGLKAVVFDLDDTLYSEKEYVRSGYKAVAEIVKDYIPNAEDKLWKAFEKKQNAIDVVLHDSGIYSDELKEQCIHAYRFQVNPEIHLYDGVKRMLEEMRDSGFLLGMITDGRPEGQRAKISALGISSLFDPIIITDELGGIEYRKPCDQAFVLMQQFLNVPFENIAYVGDNIKKDFVSPEKLGMRSIWFNNADGIYKVGE